LADFYNAEVLSDAKKKQLLDISAMSLAIKVPHVSQRRDGDIGSLVKSTCLYCSVWMSIIYWMIFRDMWLREQIVCLQSECRL